MEQQILIIEDDRIMRVTMEDLLKEQGYGVLVCENGEEGMKAFRKGAFALIITDIRLPDMKGLDVLRQVREENADIPVIVMTAFGTIKDAVAAIKLGAFDYITKPFALEEFNLIVKRAFEIRALKDGESIPQRTLPECYSYPNIIGKSREMKKVYELITKVSLTGSNILILGENGTGKELAASTIHYQSKRKDGPLIKVNCAALPEHLVESELFGYEKGAFTGATRTKPGRFERADGGTIFLDEIGDLPPSVQIKMLRVLQDSTFERLGGTETISVDVRVIAATNKKLWGEVQEGRFREDLYYRLNVIPVFVPPLRDRKEDIPLLLDHFLECYNSSFDKRVSWDGDALADLMDYDFPGNVRELENIVERCVALSAEGTVTRGDLPSHIIKMKKDGLSAVTLSEVSAEAEKAHIIKILQSTRGNRTRAAEILGISRKSLWEKVKSYNIEL